VNGDGLADIVTGADASGGPHVKVFSGKDGSVLQSFFAFGPTFTGGVRVAAQDINGDGRADIVTGAGPGGAPIVEAFSGVNGQLIFSAMAYAPNFTGGVYVAAGDVNRDGRADIITGAGEGGGPHVKVFSGATGQTLMSFLGFPVSTLGSSQFVGDAGWTSGVRVAVVGMNGGTDIVVAPGPGHANRVRALNVLSLTEDGSFQAADPAFLGGIFLGS
jgi:hypothetical protein